MEDPWANAWGGDAASPKPPEKWSSSTPSTSLHDHEDDLGQSPSWTAAAEPLGVVDVAWSGNDHAPSWSVDPVSSGGWNPSLYDDIPLGGPSPDAPQPDIEAEPLPDESDEETVTQSETNDDPPHVSSEVVLERHAGPDANDDVDGFGSFESGAGGEETRSALPWTPSAPIFPTQDSDEWGTPSWDDGADTDLDTNSGEREEVVDEWAEAKRTKALRDRQIPPELLASILQQASQLAEELWPPNTPDAANKSAAYAGEYKSMEDLSNDLVLATTRLMPTLTLPARVPFATTTTSKELLSALKLTRRLPISQRSPMAIFVASKGNGEWEASLRSQSPGSHSDNEPSVTKQDAEFINGGLGWRVLGADEREDLEEAWAKELSSRNGVKTQHKSPKGGWFWNRRSSTNVTTSNSTQPTPKVSMDETGKHRASTSGSRSSVDSESGKTIPSVGDTGNPPDVKPSDADATAVSTPASTTLPVPPALTEAAPAGDAGSSQSLGTLESNDSPTPSAVSRFFNRFSRSKPSALSPEPISPPSLALSNNDLEFLGDVPTLSSDHSHSLLGLGDQDVNLLDVNMLGKEPVRKVLRKTAPPIKLPPALSPPPKAPPTPKPLSIIKPAQPSSDLSFFDQPFVDAAPTAPSQPVQTTSSFDLDFQLLDAPSTTTLSPAPPSPHLPPKDYPPPLISQSTTARKPHLTSKRPPIVAVMSKASSSSLNNVFNLPPPPGSSQRSASPFMIPPPSSRSATPPVIPQAQGQHKEAPSQGPFPPSGLDDDDEFSDFHSSVPTTSFASTPIKPLSSASSIPSYDTSFSSAHSQQNLFSASTRSKPLGGLEDDFDDFVSSPTLRTPSPPKPPAKPSSLIGQLSRPASPLRVSQTPSALSSGISSLANSPPPGQQLGKLPGGRDHSRTKGLMDIASTKLGVWPAPRSPTPSPLAPPPNGLPKVEPLKQGGTTAVPPSLSSPALSSSFNHSPLSDGSLSPPSSIFASQSSIPVLVTSAQAIQPASPTLLDSAFSSLASATSTNGQNSASSSVLSLPQKQQSLSAQDLSFFEGL
ncbi:hypothetical protein CCMSSC00406_0004935 [Pleurotus cornucopiae]|uniref:Uncharacterized protein n=1 Tax=Pleurotus cornucopiae TaxID=5321 RepID=A0ACB7IZL5_PLECO|nr:hypothetical protein CCMSSC00406_0004935 [Pleurotus cornucopiae]